MAKHTTCQNVSNNCQKWLQQLFDAIDPDLAEELPSTFESSALAQVIEPVLSLPKASTQSKDS